jgi:hypothetical protein
MGQGALHGRHSEAVEPGTVWTWNAIGKAAGAWNLDARRQRVASQGFLLNHLISEELPVRSGGARFSNSDPVTGQAAWYDVRVRIYPAGPASRRPGRSSPPCRRPGHGGRRRKWQAWFAGKGGSDTKGGAQ